MPSLTRKIIKGHSYYYVRHCQRVDGKPKIVKTTYLGSLDNILQTLDAAQTPPPPKRAEVLAFGDIAALYDQALQLDLVKLVDATGYNGTLSGTPTVSEKGKLSGAMPPE